MSLREENEIKLFWIIICFSIIIGLLSTMLGSLLIFIILIPFIVLTCLKEKVLIRAFIIFCAITPGYIYITLEQGWKIFSRAILPTDILTVFLIIFMLVNFLNKKEKIKIINLDILMLVWLGIISISATRGLLNWPENAYMGARNYTIYFLYFVSVGYFVSKEKIISFFKYIVYAACVFFLISLISSLYLKANGIWEMNSVFSRSEIFIYGAVFICPLIVSINLLFFKFNFIKNKLLVLAMLFSLGGIFLSFTRSLQVSIAIGIILACIMNMWKGNMNLKLVLRLGLFVSSLFIMVLLVDNYLLDNSIFKRLLDTNMKEETLRASEYGSIWGEVSTSLGSLLFGRGIGAEVYHPSLGISVPYVHNEYLNILNANGLIGLSIFGILIITLLKFSLELTFNNGDNVQSFIGMSSFISMIVFLIQSFYAGQLVSLSSTGVLIILFAITRNVYVDMKFKSNKYDRNSEMG